jgi:hypothetical protein
MWTFKLDRDWSGRANRVDRNPRPRADRHSEPDPEWGDRRRIVRW